MMGSTVIEKMDTLIYNKIVKRICVKMLERISTDPKICHGQACLKGTRIPVYQILHMLANGDTIEELVKEYTSLKREDILACIEYG